jgi:two-component system catabolic regulation response regulator CreB
VNRIFKCVEALKQSFRNISIFNGEKDLLEFLQQHRADVILLNLDLQPNDAVILVKEIRMLKTEFCPYIVIYSEKQDDFVQELAFSSGADSFINFHNKPPVLELFLKNLLKRKIEIKPPQNRELIVDNERYLIFRHGEAFQLPRKEFMLFELLYNGPGKFFSKEEIAGLIWKDISIAKKRTIDVHIYNIRQFFGKRIIQSQKGKGYRINRKVLGQNNSLI